MCYMYLLMLHLLAAVVLETTDQQLTAMNEGGNTLTTSHPPPLSTGMEAQDSDAQQGLEETPVSYSSSQSVRNGKST